MPGLMEGPTSGHGDRRSETCAVWRHSTAARYSCERYAGSRQSAARLPWSSRFLGRSIFKLYHGVCLNDPFRNLPNRFCQAVPMVRDRAECLVEARLLQREHPIERLEVLKFTTDRFRF